MKKLSLVLCFALMLVLVFAFNVFAATKNDITAGARFEQNGSSSDLLDLDMVIDGDYNTASSCGNAGEDWVNYRFYYDEGTTVSKVFVVLNSTGTLSNGKTYETLSDCGYEFYIRLYNYNNSTVYNQKFHSTNSEEIKSATDEQGNVLYSYFEIEFETPYQDVYMVEVPVVNNKNADVGLWEVEIYNYICDEAEHTWVGELCGEHCDVCNTYKNTDLVCVPEEDDGDCRTAILCQYCDSVIVASKKHVFAEGETVCSNEGCVFEGTNIVKETSITPVDVTENTYGENGEFMNWWYYSAHITDGKYDTIAHSNYWGQYKFTFNLKNPTVLSEIFIVSNSSGVYHPWGYGHDNLTTDLAVKVIIYDADGNAIQTTEYNSLDFTNPNVVPIYSADGKLTSVGYKLDTNYANAKKVELFINQGVWEVEIYKHVTCDYQFVETVAPECTTEGYDLYKCACGNEKHENTVAALGHSYDDGVITKEAGEEEDGEIVYTCQTCGDKNILAIPATGHEHNYDTFVVNSVEPGCATVGSATYKCRCGDTTEVEIPATGNHNYTEFAGYTVEPTYLNNGYADYKCATCDATINVNVGRLQMNTAKYAQAVLEMGGWTAEGVQYLNDCNYNVGCAGSHSTNGWAFSLNYGEDYYFNKLVFVVNSVGTHPRPPFSYTEKTTKNYSFAITLYDANGNAVWTKSTTCADGVEMSGIDANGNEFLYDAVTIELDEAVVASKLYVKINSGWDNGAGMWEVETYGLPVNYHEVHDYTKLIEKYSDPVSCIEPGSGLFRCAKCEETAVLPITIDHTFNQEVEGTRVDATCIAEGSVTFKCANCDATEVQTLEKIGHDENTAYIEVEIEPASCVAEGKLNKICAVCNEVLSEETIPATGEHNYIAGEPAEDGSITYTCACGDYYVIYNAVINGEYYLDTEPVVFNNGVMTFFGEEFAYTYNATTGMVDIENPPVAGMFFQVIDGVICFKGATPLHKHDGSTYIVEDGSLICNACGVANIVLDGAYYMQANAIVFANGTVTMQDSTANYTYDVATGKIFIEGAGDGILSVVGGTIYYMGRTPLHQHNEADYITEVTEPTCTEDGFTTYICQFCGPLFTDDEVEATGHSYFYACDAHCQVCGELTNEDAAHTIVHVEEKAATCFENGNVEYWYCSDCRTAWTDEALTQQTNMMSVVIPMAHGTITHVEAKDATCTENGNIEYWYCEACGYAWLDAGCTLNTNLMAVVLPKAEHVWSETPEAITPPTCIATGVGKYFCTNCWTYDVDRGEVEMPINPENHGESMQLNDASTFGTCSDCGAYAFFGTHKGIGENDLIWLFMGNQVNIYKNDWSVDVYYNTVLAYSEETGYTVTLSAITEGDYGYDTTYDGCTVTIVINEDGTLLITLGDLVFGSDGSEEEPDQPGEDFDYIINGTFATADGSVKVEFKDGTATVLVNTAGVPLPETFSYTYNPMIGTIDCDGVPMNVSYDLDQDAIYFGMMPLFRVSDSGSDEPEEPVNYGDKIGSIEVVTTDNNAWADMYTYVADKAGQYAFYVPGGYGLYSVTAYDAWDPAEADYGNPFNPNTNGVYVVVNLEAGAEYSFYVMTPEKGETWKCDVYYYVEHVHTEVAVDAILPTPSTTGYTAGVVCSECDEVLEGCEEINITEISNDKEVNTVFRIAAINLSAQESLSVNYKALVTAGYKNPYVVFVFNGEEYIVTDYKIEASSGRYVFNFNETFPQLMQDNIEAYLYGETAEGEYTMTSYLEYSVMQYIVGQIKKNDAALTTVMSDILYMGAMTQIKQNYKTNALVTDLVTAMGYTLTPSTFTSIPDDVKVKTIVSGDRTTGTDWKTVNLALGATTELKFGFETDNLEGLTVKITVAGQTYSYDASELKTEGGRYFVYFDKVRSYEYNEVVTATFERNGEQVGSTLTYTVNTFLASNYENSGKYGAADRNLMKALYTYGESISKYFA